MLVYLSWNICKNLYSYFWIYFSGVYLARPQNREEETDRQITEKETLNHEKDIKIFYNIIEYC